MLWGHWVRGGKVEEVVMVGHQKFKNLLLINYLLNCYINLLYYYYNLTLYFIQLIILVMYNSLLNFIYSLFKQHFSFKNITRECT